MDDSILPTDEQIFDAAIALRKELTDMGQDPELVNINSWQMAATWVKDFITKKK